MKILFENTFVRICFTFCAICVISSCSDEVLEEKPVNFLSPSNAFSTVDGYETGIADLHQRARSLRTQHSIGAGLEGDKAITTVYANGTDLSWFIVPAQNQFTDYSRINSANSTVTRYWRSLFKIISNASTIVDRVRASELETSDKLVIEAKARFFRGYAYRFLVHLWGGVPIIDAEVTAPVFNYTRATKEQTLEFIREDLEFASANLPTENPGDGRLSAAVADHFLTEILISLGEYDAAVTAATRVINDGQYQLMTNRFGNHTSMNGDVFWDLFRGGNQDRSSGNTETIWFFNLGFNIPGGDADHDITRAWACLRERLVDSEGERAWIGASDTLGRGVGFVKPTLYLDSLIWESDFDNDMRNSRFNMQREFINNNPASVDYLQVIQPRPSDLGRNHFVLVTKAVAPEGYPQGYAQDGEMFTDIYAARLAETYLLRAEAHFLNGNSASAADDINVVRNRANATPVAPGDVDLDYILDERARELVAEEPRRLTLARMNVLPERVRRYNPISQESIQDFHNLWPIPQEEIDANLESDLVQNPGYN